MIVRAPGKLFLAGEYAVLLGARALLAAVPPWGTYHGPPQPRRFVARYPGAAPGPGDGVVDTSGFFFMGRKLGFGSSACAAVLQAAAYGPMAPDALWEAAKTRHDAMGGRGGSGGDLAAIIHGGTGIFDPKDGSFQRIPFPASAALIVVDGGRAADTREWSARFRAIALNGQTGQWRAEVDGVIAKLLADGNWSVAMDTAARLYARLSEWLGDSLYPEPFQRCVRIADALGVPFKPSGAGGGDKGFFYAGDSPTRAAVCAELRAAGLEALVVRPAVSGVCWFHGANDGRCSGS